MKMKILLYFLCFLLTKFVCLKAEEIPIILTLEEVSRDYRDDRSILIVPTASHEGRSIYIRTDWPCDRLYVEVEDADGMRVFAGMPDALRDTEYSLEIPGNGAGAYTLWVLVDETMYVGEFEVE